MMQLTPQKIAAIRALANDERGDPNTRAIAKRKLEQMRREHPEAFKANDDPIADIINRINQRYAQNKPHPGMQKSPEYEHWRFMGMDNWKKTDRGNYWIATGSYRVTLFRQDGCWKWVTSINARAGSARFSTRKFSLIHEAMQDAWASLKM